MAPTSRNCSVRTSPTGASGSATRPSLAWREPCRPAPRSTSSPEALEGRHDDLCDSSELVGTAQDMRVVGHLTAQEVGIRWSVGHRMPEPWQEGPPPIYSKRARKPGLAG